MTIRQVFEQSKANGGRYVEPEPCAWNWPSGTWLQFRRERLRGLRDLSLCPKLVKLEKELEQSELDSSPRSD